MTASDLLRQIKQCEREPVPLTHVPDRDLPKLLRLLKAYHARSTAGTRPTRRPPA
jgi:hypothetical protein